MTARARARSSAGWRTTSPAAPRCMAHPGLAETTTGSVPRVTAGRGAQCRHLAGADLARQLGLEHRVGPARPAAQAVVTGLAESIGGREHCPHRAVGVLDVAEVARVLHHHDRAGVEQVERRAVGHELGEVAHPGRERGRLGSAEQVPVLLHRRAAPRAVDHDRPVAGHRPDHAPGQPARLGDPPRVEMEGAAAIATGPRQPRARSRRPHHGERVAVDIALPRVHDAPGEEVRVELVGARGGVGDERLAQLADREARHAEPLRYRVEPLPDEDHPRHRQQQPVPGQQEAVADPLGHPAEPPPGIMRRASGGEWLAGERFAGPFDEMTERHTRGARGFTAAALHARLHALAERTVDGRAVELDRTHSGDATAR